MSVNYSTNFRIFKLFFNFQLIRINIFYCTLHSFKYKMSNKKFIAYDDISKI